MVLNQRQVLVVVSDWEPYLGSLGFTVGLWVFVSMSVTTRDGCGSGISLSCFIFHGGQAFLIKNDMDTYHAVLWSDPWSDPRSSDEEEEICRYNAVNST